MLRKSEPWKKYMLTIAAGICGCIMACIGTVAILSYLSVKGRVGEQGVLTIISISIGLWVLLICLTIRKYAKAISLKTFPIMTLGLVIILTLIGGSLMGGNFVFRWGPLASAGLGCATACGICLKRPGKRRKYKSHSR